MRWVQRRQVSTQEQHGTAQYACTHARAQVESSQTAIDAFNNEKKNRKKARDKVKEKGTTNETKHA